MIFFYLVYMPGIMCSPQIAYSVPFSLGPNAQFHG